MTADSGILLIEHAIVNLEITRQEAAIAQSLTKPKPMHYLPLTLRR